MMDKRVYEKKDSPVTLEQIRLRLPNGTLILIHVDDDTEPDEHYKWSHGHAEYNVGPICCHEIQQYFDIDKFWEIYKEFKVLWVEPKTIFGELEIWEEGTEGLKITIVDSKSNLRENT